MMTEYLCLSELLLLKHSKSHSKMAVARAGGREEKWKKTLRRKSHYQILHMKARCSILSGQPYAECGFMSYLCFWEELKFQHDQGSPLNPHSFQVVCTTFTHKCTVQYCMKYVYVSFMILWSVCSEPVKQM